MNTTPVGLVSRESVRDPRVDPQEGDVVRNAAGTFYVTGRKGSLVYYTDAPSPEELSIPLDEWSLYAAKDVIVSRGEDRG